MRLLEDHLSPHDLATLPVSPEALASGGPDQQQLSLHLQQCEACSGLAQTHWRLRSLRTPDALATSSESCPAEEVWLELAAGLCPEQSGALLAHAAGCSTCAVTLREAMELMQPDPLEQLDPDGQSIAGLASATPAWQRRIAAQMKSMSGQSLLYDRPSKTQGLTLLQNIRRKPVWFMLPAAAAILCAVLLGGLSLWRSVHPSEARLLALAYNKQRTLVLRIPGADPVPLASGTRGATSGLTDPTELIELRLRVQQHLDQTPNSPYWHQVLGQIQLLQQDGRGARSSFETARATDPNLPNIRSDLAAALFEIGSSPENANVYAEAIHLYTEEIRERPSDPLLYYNRALCWERQGIISNANDDLRLALSFEHSAAWRKAIEAEIARLSTRSAAVPTDSYETSLSEATEKLLPYWNDSAEVRAKISRTATLGLHHQDHWLVDWIAASHTPTSNEGDRHLSAAIASNTAGEAESSLAEARHAIELYAKAGDGPGALRAQLAETYALQRLGRANECLQKVGTLLAGRIKDYSWLYTQALLEQGSCAAVTGDFTVAQRSLESGAEMSVVSNLPMAHLRAVGFEAWTLDSKGLGAAAWQANTTGIQLCEQNNCSALTKYQFLHNMVLGAEHMDFQDVAAQLMRTAAHLAGESGDITTHAYAIENFATLAGLTGDYTSSTRAFSEAALLAHSGKQAVMNPLYQADWQTDQAEVLSRRGAADSALRLLQQNAPALLASNYQPGRLHYFTQLADVQLSLGQSDEALASALAAVREAEQSLILLHSTTDKEQWARRNSKSYTELVKIYLQRGEDTEALHVWERFRRAPYAQDPASMTSPVHQFLNQHVLVLARIDDIYVGWIATTGPLRSIQALRLGDAQKLREQATTFYRLCADRDSSLADVRMVGAQLYISLMKPFEKQVNSSNQIWIDADPSLAMVPFAALTLSNGAWLGQSLRSNILPAWWTIDPTKSFNEVSITPTMQMVAVNGFDEEDGGQSTTIASEAAEVTHLFPGAMLVQGNSVNTRALFHALESADIFHFSGHATAESGPRLLLASSDAEHSADLTAESMSSLHLHRCKVAVLAACNTTASDPDQIEKLPDLRNALLHAGANTVVASNWDVDDLSTHSLMLAFYKQLALGLSPADSLHIAQQSVRTDSRWHHPYFWAPFEIFTN